MGSRLVAAIVVVIRHRGPRRAGEAISSGPLRDLDDFAFVIGRPNESIRESIVFPHPPRFRVASLRREEPEM